MKCSYRAECPSWRAELGFCLSHHLITPGFWPTWTFQHSVQRVCCSEFCPGAKGQTVVGEKGSSLDCLITAALFIWGQGKGRPGGPCCWAGGCWVAGSARLQRQFRVCQAGCPKNDPATFGHSGNLSLGRDLIFGGCPALASGCPTLGSDIDGPVAWSEGFVDVVKSEDYGGQPLAMEFCPVTYKLCDLGQIPIPFWLLVFSSAQWGY